jgi:FAD/FMN-containing dehydrogenase
LQASSSGFSVETATTSQVDTDKYIPNDKEFRNWAQIASCKPQFYHEPLAVSELVELIAYATANQQKIRVVGSMHSAANIAFTNDHLVSLNKYAKVLGLDRERNTVRVRSIDLC